jgi:hypothetical protein
MTEDPRCCGSGTCIIDDAGQCWCGQRWNGREMCAPPLSTTAATVPPASAVAVARPAAADNGERPA